MSRIPCARSVPLPGRLLAAIPSVVALVLVLAGCGGGDSTADTTEPPSTTSTIPEVADVLIDRLSDELGDEQLAFDVVASMDPGTIEQLESTLGPDGIATSPVLAYRPEPTPGPVDHLVVLAFGNRVGPDGTVTPGPVNEALADAVATYVATNPTPVHAQWEVAQLLQARGVPDVVSIEPRTGPDGQPTYLSTQGVMDQVVAQARADGVDLGTVGVVAFADHVVRAASTAEASGMDVVVVEGIDLPSEYDPESGQEWTRDRASYLTVDLAGRIAAL